MLITKLTKLVRSIVIAGGLCVTLTANAATELKVAFNQSDKHPQYQALKYLSENLSKETDGRYKLNIYPNELLGDQRASLELVQNGAIHMAIVANPLVENYDKTFSVIALPYIYNSLEHQEKVFTGNVLDELFASTKKFGFEVLGAYTAGARSVYTKSSPVKSIADLNGRKIRVMQSNTMIKMLACMGGTGVPMNQGEVYTAIQQGVLDGAENNEITYMDLKQYEVAPYFSRTKHLMVPDLLVISEQFLSSLSEKDQAILKRLVKESIQKEYQLWREQVLVAEQFSKDKGAEFLEVDIKPFQDSCQGLQNDLIKTDFQKQLFEKILSLI
ncbi:tripartite ATP-independent transporter DctP family solute receptor [Cricetibacter osteomyelitidis]|uniref:Tripartite ATP-independent transporter DctP family solute receptor n=1 Tax=Cricetibacter osteomyelitidis TaxID=1521931 RepID=A0A4R2T2W8_9PAST|nr:TRAP transporter substrate-binding protein [Cricetibacter osteomyelitidis]TCP96580.1 tripartite ATP-independent transporter DctP family solute receptor [Cricetibacter osteomyelitidis]